VSGWKPPASSSIRRRSTSEKSRSIIHLRRWALSSSSHVHQAGQFVSGMSELPIARPCGRGYLPNGQSPVAGCPRQPWFDSSRATRRAARQLRRLVGCAWMYGHSGARQPSGSHAAPPVRSTAGVRRWRPTCVPESPMEP
jgi:hypothetical protein